MRLMRAPLLPRLPARAAGPPPGAGPPEAGARSPARSEAEHPRRLVVRECGDLLEGVDVPLREHEQMGLGDRIDVANRDEAVGVVNGIPLHGKPAEEAVFTSGR